MREGILVRAWRWLFARDSHEECRKALEQERLAAQWHLDRALKMLEATQAKAMEMADPGINWRFGAKPNGKEKPIKVDPKPEPEMLPGIG